jgi:hypothetical protein
VWVFRFFGSEEAWGNHKLVTPTWSLVNTVICYSLFTKPYPGNDGAVLLRVCVAMGMLLHSNGHLQISTVAELLSMFATCGRIPWKARTCYTKEKLWLHVESCDFLWISSAVARVEEHLLCSDKCPVCPFTFPSWYEHQLWSPVRYLLWSVWSSFAARWKIGGQIDLDMYSGLLVSACRAVTK